MASSSSTGRKRRHRDSHSDSETEDATMAKVNAVNDVDNSKTVITKIANLYAERLMSDVLLVVGSQEFPSHRLILCASSDVFQIMLMNPSWTEHSETKIVLKETPSCEAVFEDFLKYLYTGKIQLDYATVIPIVSLADKYNVKDLLRIGLDYMSRNVSTACKRHQVVSWYQFASASGHNGIADLCRDFILWNFGVVAENIDFPNMETESLVGFISRSDLVISDELTVFKIVDKWLSARREIMERAGEDHIDLHMDAAVSEVIPHIRFPMMSPAQLADLLLSPLAKSHTHLLVDKIRLAMSYHKDQLPTPVKSRWKGHFYVTIPGQDPKLFSPRLYTAESFCASFAINHVPNLSSYHCRSLLFSTQRYTADWEGDESSEWVVDVFPKGVWYQKCLTVYRPQGLEVPERVLKTVRVSVWTRQEVEQRVRLGILILGRQDGYDHVRKVVSRNYVFGPDDQIVNFDDVIDFEELNHLKRKSNFLIGDEEEALNVMVVATPLSRLSTLDT